MDDGDPHATFNRAVADETLYTVWGFGDHAAENQGQWSPSLGTTRQIDSILDEMWDQGPGGGHHDNIANPLFRRVGIAVATDGLGRLYLTNDFSD
jgi:hypothetical protein